jgi:hypothetical protein
MQISRVNLDEFCAIVEAVSVNEYRGNVIVASDAHEGPGNGCTARLKVQDSYGYGARTSRTGRHGPIACWHAYRNVLRELFDRFPTARVRTRLAIYRGRSGFEEHFPQTAYANIGSQAQPAYAEDLCACDEDGPAAMERQRRPSRRTASIMLPSSAQRQLDVIEELLKCGACGLLSCPHCWPSLPAIDRKG